MCTTTFTRRPSFVMQALAFSSRELCPSSQLLARGSAAEVDTSTGVRMQGQAGRLHHVAHL